MKGGKVRMGSERNIERENNERKRTEDLSWWSWRQMRVGMKERKRGII